MIIPKYFSDSVLLLVDEMEYALGRLPSETKSTPAQFMGAHNLLRKASEADVETLLETLTKISMAILLDLSHSECQRKLYSLMVKTGKMIETCAKLTKNQEKRQGQGNEEVPDFYQTCLALANPLSSLTRKVKCEMLLRSEENENTWISAAERVILLSRVKLKNQLQLKVRNLSKKHLYVSLYYFGPEKKVIHLDADYSYTKKESDQIESGKALTVSRVFDLPKLFNEENSEFEANLKVFITESPHNFEWVATGSHPKAEYEALLETAAWGTQNHSFYLKDYRILVATPEDLTYETRKEILCHWSNYQLVTPQIRHIFLDDLRRRLQWDLVDPPYFFIASDATTGTALRDGYYTGEIHLKREELQPSVKICFRESLETGILEVCHDLKENHWKELTPVDLLELQTSLYALEGQKPLVIPRKTGMEETGFFRGGGNATRFIKGLKSLGGQLNEYLIESIASYGFYGLGSARLEPKRLIQFFGLK